MSNRTSYEGETQHLGGYQTPPESGSTVHFDDTRPSHAPVARPSRRPDRSSQRTSLLLGLLAILLGVALPGNGGIVPVSGGFIERTTTISESYDVRNLALSVGNGNITLTRAAGDELEVEAISHGYGWTPGAAERAAARVQPEIGVAGDTLRIEEDRFDAINLFGRSPYVEYHIAVPDNVEASVSTGSGNLEAGEIAGTLAFKTGSGDISVRDGQGAISAETGSGNIDVDGLVGELRASTGSGDVTVENAERTAISLETGSGNVDFDGSLPADGRHRISTGSGDISVRLPEDAGVDLRAETGSGDIDIDEAWNANVDENSATTRLGSGGATLELQASSGNVTVEAE